MTQVFFCLMKNTNAKDKFYQNSVSNFHIEAFWGYNEDNITFPITVSNNLYTFKRDVNRRENYLKCKIYIYCIIRIGIREWNKYSDDHNLIPIHEACAEFKPVTVPESDVSVQFPKDALKE